MEQNSGDVIPTSGTKKCVKIKLHIGETFLRTRYRLCAVLVAVWQIFNRIAVQLHRPNEAGMFGR